MSSDAELASLMDICEQSHSGEESGLLTDEDAFASFIFLFLFLFFG